MGCYVRGDKNGMGCYVRGGKNTMGCFVQGGKSLWDVLAGVSKNGMGCFVPRCFVRLPAVTCLVSCTIKLLQKNDSIYKLKLVSLRFLVSSL